MAGIRPAVPAVGASAALFWAGAVAAQDKPPAPAMDLPSLVRALQGGGYVIYFRHAASDQSSPDSPERLDLENCATQRNLSQKGREQAQVIGKAFAALGIKVAAVLSSPYCRCVDTAKLAFGKAVVAHDLEFAMAKNETESKRLTAPPRPHPSAQPRPRPHTRVASPPADPHWAGGRWAPPP